MTWNVDAVKVKTIRTENIAMNVERQSVFCATAAMVIIPMTINFAVIAAFHYRYQR